MKNTNQNKKYMDQVKNLNKEKKRKKKKKEKDKGKAKNTNTDKDANQITQAVNYWPAYLAISVFHPAPTLAP